MKRLGFSLIVCVGHSSLCCKCSRVADCEWLAGQEIVPSLQLLRFCRSGALCYAGYGQNIWQSARVRSRTIDQKSLSFALFVFFFTHYFPLFGRSSALFSLFPFFRTLPDALYRLHIVFDILVDEYQLTLIFYEQGFPEKGAFFG